MKTVSFDFAEKDLFIEKFGGDVYAVGGYVRDLIRQKPSQEVDLLIRRHQVGEIIEKLSPCGKVDLVGRSFGVIKFTIKGNTYDIALPRSDRPRNSGVPGHKDFIVQSEPDMPLEQDLKRRDFRCNSMALRLADGQLIDPFNGIDDIKKSVLRMTDENTFSEDPLRVLRAARFASVLEFTPEQKINTAARKIDLSRLSAERVNEELFRILLQSPRPSVGLEQFFILGVLEQLYPELYTMTLTIQDSVFHPEKDAFGHHTVWHHTCLTVDQAGRLARRFELVPARKLALLLAALFHDIGKPALTRWDYKKDRMVVTSQGHDIEGAVITKKVFDRFKIFSWNGYNLRRTVLVLIKLHHRPSELWNNRDTVTKKAFNRLAAEINSEVDLLAYLDAADRAGRTEKPVEELDREAVWLLNKFEEYNITEASIQPLLQGRDLIELGMKPGPEMGRMLKKLYALQLDDAFETREEGLNAARKLIDEENV